uniref:Pectin acetylesterase n=1 Tax=Araucaria cunninghamii TaxID=56994 RepID=A0A0D6QVS9_ARACU
MESKALPKSVGYVFAFTLLILMVSPTITVQLVAAAGDNLVNLTVLHDAVAKGAVCLDGSPPAYYFDNGFGSGANNWLVFIEGGAWCQDKGSCMDRAKTYLGSSLYMDKQTAFDGILHNQQSYNPDFYNWNRVVVRYCDGSSFTGDVREVNQSTGNLYFRGQRIWDAVMEHFLAKGMDKAQQVLLTGCSAGGLATFLHCDKFKELFPEKAKVKCMADAGFFLDVETISAQNFIGSFFKAVATLHGSEKNLPSVSACLPDRSQCFFPQNLVESIRTSFFILNAAYDSWQVQNILVPGSADPNNTWQNCKQNIANCAPEQLNILQSFRDKMIGALKPAEASKTGGLFINSCYTHCQAPSGKYWHSPSSPKLHSKTIAEAVGDWYFDRASVKYIDCPYPCDGTCLNDIQTQ